MKKSLIVLMMVLLCAMLMVSCDDNKEKLPSVSKIGETISLGNVTWEALWVDAENKSAYLISKDILEQKMFDSNEPGSSSYKDSSIRKYLTGDFIAAHGLSTSYMKATNLSDASVTDYIFIPSEAEINLYLSRDIDKVAKYNGEADDWWLRTPDDDKVRIVNSDGTINYQVSVATTVGVRPAFWYTWN